MRTWQALGVFCEDIREEKQGSSLMGVMPDNVAVGSIPGAFPKIGIYVRCQVSPSTDAGEITVKVRYSDGSESELGGFDADLVRKTQQAAIETGIPWAGFIVSALASPFPIQKSGIVQVLANFAGEEVVCAALNIKLIPNPSANASEPPA